MFPAMTKVQSQLDGIKGDFIVAKDRVKQMNFFI